MTNADSDLKNLAGQSAVNRGFEVMSAAIQQCGHAEVLRILREQLAVCARNQHKPIREQIKINRSGDTVLDPVVSAEKITVSPFNESINEFAGMAIALASHLYLGAYQRADNTAAFAASEQSTEKELQQ